MYGIWFLILIRVNADWYILYTAGIWTFLA